MPSKPKFAVWSGYEIDKESFRHFISMLLEIPEDPEDDDVCFIAAYDSWKHRLPRRDRAKAPNIHWRRSNPEGGDITHIFFLLRWRAYESERQLDDPTHPDYAAIHEPTEKEKASFERWLSYVNERFGGKAHIDASVFRFAAMKNLHPSVKVGPLSLFRMWGVFTNFDSGDDSITRPRHYSFAMFLLSPKVWYQQGRLQEEMSENSRAFETYEKLGVTDVSETPRALLQEIERAVNSRPAPENLDTAAHRSPPGTVA